MSIDPNDTGSRIPDPDGPLPDDMDVDFRPEDWLGPLPDASAETISDDFVARAFAAVQSDQAEIADEAAQLDETQFSAEFLAQYQLPPISTDFANKAAERVAEDYAKRDHHWREALAAYTAPEPSDEFIDRTLEVLDLPVPTAMGPRALETASSAPLLESSPAAVSAPAAGSSPEQVSPGLRLLPSRGRSAMLAAALILITATAAIFSGIFDVPRYDTPLASSLSPQPWATSLARLEQKGNHGAHLRQTDGLLFAAHHASLRSTGAGD